MKAFGQANAMRLAGAGAGALAAGFLQGTVITTLSENVKNLGLVVIGAIMAASFDGDVGHGFGLGLGAVGIASLVRSYVLVG